MHGHVYTIFCIPTVNQRHLFSLIDNIQPHDIVFLSVTLNAMKQELIMHNFYFGCLATNFLDFL